MPSGGHVRSGPAPDPNALRRERPSDQAGWVHLPASGREGPAPEWPLSRATSRETELWEQDWRRPQAIMWEANGQERSVAMYVRALAVAERPKAFVAMRTLVRQYEDSLGISLPGLRSLRWIIDREVDARAPGKVSSTARASARERFKVVANAG